MDLNFDLIDRSARSAVKYGIEFLHLTGGEPFLYPELEKIFSLARSLCLRVTFSTNGLLLKENSSLLKEYAKEVGLINISLDGARREIHEKTRGAGSFDRVLDAFDFCRSLKLPFGVLHCVNKVNQSAILDVVRLGKKIKAAHVNFTTVLPCSNALENGLVLDSAERAALYQELIRLRNLASQDFLRLFYVPVYICESIYTQPNIVMCNTQMMRMVTVDVDGSLHFCCFLTVYDVAAQILSRLRVVSLEEKSFDEALVFLEQAYARLHAQRISEYESPKLKKMNMNFNSCFYCNRKLGISKIEK